jgi:hypothetical protein
LPPRHQPVPIKAQIREGSTQKVPGPPEVASKSPRPSAPLPTPASSVSTDSSVNPGTGVVPNAPPQGANAVSSPSSPSAPALATPASAPGASSP